MPPRTAAAGIKVTPFDSYASPYTFLTVTKSLVSVNRSSNWVTIAPLLTYLGLARALVRFSILA
jgi:hypothetical protein